MTALICLSSTDANKYQSDVDAAQGYPKDGIDIGGGIHASKAESRTYHQANVMKHPVNAVWAYLDDTTIGDAKGVAKPVGATVQVLDATWFPAAVIV